MSLKAQTYVIPEETAELARAIFPEGNLVMNLYDELGIIFEDEDFADLYPLDGQPALSPVRLALASILQFREGLTDRQAADAVKTKIDWKYLLCLELQDQGFHHTVLSEFRSRLLKGGAEQRLFEKILELAKHKGLVKAGGHQRTDSSHILGAMRAMTRMECVTETLRHALNVLAEVAPEWLLAHRKPDWLERYGPRASEYRLPKSDSKRLSWVQQTGQDGYDLLKAMYADESMTPFCNILAVETLRQVWLQNFEMINGRIHWRENKHTPPAGLYIGSPYDTEARYQLKRTTGWSGYKILLTESCDDETPNIITNVATSHAAVSDDAMTAKIHAALAQRDLLPEQHLADTGFVNSELIVLSQQDYAIDLMGPSRADNSWQGKEGKGFSAQDFRIIWDKKHAVCPEGKASISWTPAFDRVENEVVKIKFSMTDCKPCPSRELCTKAKTHRRTISIRPQAQHEALIVRREREQTPEFKTDYAKRSGVEGTIAQGTRSCEMRRSRYFGEAKTHLGHLMTATAMNLVRMLNWLDGLPKSAVKPSAFQRLCAA
jgi:transposase